MNIPCRGQLKQCNLWNYNVNWRWKKCFSLVQTFWHNYEFLGMLWEICWRKKVAPCKTTFASIGLKKCGMKFCCSLVKLLFNAKRFFVSNGMLGAVNMVTGTKIDFHDLSNKTCIFSFIYFNRWTLKFISMCQAKIWPVSRYGKLALRQWLN